MTAPAEIALALAVGIPFVGAGAGLLLGARGRPWAPLATAVATFLACAGVLAALTWVVDFAAAAVGARRVGASPWAVAGAAIGTVAGIFTGLVGLLFLPLAGAAIGEYLAERDMLRAGKVGLSTWLGIVIGTALKVAIVFAMLGMFVAALLLS